MIFIIHNPFQSLFVDGYTDCFPTSSAVKVQVMIHNNWLYFEFWPKSDRDWHGKPSPTFVADTDFIWSCSRNFLLINAMWVYFWVIISHTEWLIQPELTESDKLFDLILALLVLQSDKGSPMIIILITISLLDIFTFFQLLIMISDLKLQNNFIAS